MNTNDQFNWWSRALAGEQGLPLSETPESGFYRRKLRNTFQAIAYWRDETGKLWFRADAKTAVECNPGTREWDAWPWISANPISHELYEGVTERGEPWPDLHEAVTALHNNPPDDQSFEALRDAIDDLAREAQRMADAGAAKNQATADQASDLANKLGDLEKKADTKRRAEKKPHEDAAKEVDRSWNPIRDAASAAKALLKSAVITPFLRAKDEAERKAREAAAKAGTPTPEPMRGMSTTKAGTRGRAVALRTRKYAEITDRAALLAHFSEHERITAVLQDLADGAARADVTVPGMTIKTEKVAA